MSLRLFQDLEFDKVLTLVAAHAKTGVGRCRVRDTPVLPELQESATLSRLSVETEELLSDSGSMPLAGVDEALPLLKEDHLLSGEPAELVALLSLARRIASVRTRLLALPEELGLLRKLGLELPDTRELVRWAAPRLGRDGQVPDDASPELKRLRAKLARSRQNVVAELEGVRRANPDATTDMPPTVRHGRYCIAVRASARDRLPGLVLDSSGSGATSFVEPFAVVEANNTLAETLARERAEVRRILEELIRAFLERRAELAAATEILAELDAAQARALFGRTVQGRVITPDDGGTLILCGARHPLLDPRLRSFRAELFGHEERRDEARAVVPLDFQLPEDMRTLIISGPNAGGKTVVLKTIGLMVLMAQHGIPVPVEQGTSIPIFDHIWCHIGDEQDVSADLSTFSGAMAATARLLQRAGQNSLVLYDELGTGTDPLEGAALGCALLEELTRRGCLCVATTHLAAVALNATAVPGMDNGAMDFDEELGRPTYRLRLGRPGRSHGLEIAASMGVDAALLERARELLGSQHLELDRWLGRLESLEGELIQERTELEHQLNEARAEGDRLAVARARLEQERARFPERLQNEVEALRRRAKTQLDRALATLNQATKDKKPLGKRRQQNLRHEALDFTAELSAEATGESPDEVTPGTGVRLASLGGRGTVQEVRGSQVQVAVGSKKLWVDRSELRVDEAAPKPSTKGRLQVNASDSVPAELMLLGMDSEDARREVEQYLDRAFAAGMRMVRLVHGHGTGTLRRVVGEICRQHPAVRSFRHPPGSRGGTGATEVTLEEI